MAVDTEKAFQQFQQLVQQQEQRVAGLAHSRSTAGHKEGAQSIAIIPGDGIGPTIMRHTVTVLEQLLQPQLRSGQLNLQWIEGMSLSERQQAGETVPSKVMQQLRQYPLLLKGPTSTPSALDSKPMESANVTLRRELDLFANIRPVKMPEEGIDWVLFRENTEGGYILGSQGIHFPQWALDFTVASRVGSLRIARAAYEHARQSGRTRLSIVTKANIIKATDGLFLACAREVAKDYPDIETDDWYVDIMAANLVNPQIRSSFQVLLMPNLYGDILSDEAAQIQGGVGSGGSANIGEQHAMFEAVHGSAPRLVEQGLTEYADPSGLLNASILMLEHLGLKTQAITLQQAMLCCRKQGICVTGNRCDSSGDKLVSALLKQLLSSLPQM